MISDTLICPTHGEMDLTKAAGCPECVREMRDAMRGKNLLLDSLRKDLRLRTDRLIDLEEAAQAVLDNDDPADWPACYRELDRIKGKPWNAT